MLTFGSLFAGIGGLDLGLERAGLVCKYQVEIDDYATKVLEKHWPAVARFRDVRTVGRHNLEYVDLICGGFPCQDISNAGKRAGIGGERSGLWAEFARIIRECRPAYVLIENVSALRSRGLTTVLADLAEIGFDAEWHCIPAAAVGAPHRRDRLFVLAYAARIGRGTGREGRSYPGDTRQSKQPLSHVADVYRPRLERPRICRTTPDRVEWPAEPAICRVLNGISPRLVEDRLRALGNAVVPQVAEYLGRQIVAFDEARP